VSRGLVIPKAHFQALAICAGCRVPEYPVATFWWTDNAQGHDSTRGDFRRWHDDRCGRRHAPAKPDPAVAAQQNTANLVAAVFQPWKQAQAPAAAKGKKKKK
jgi:hypothetical protein